MTKTIGLSAKRREAPVASPSTVACLFIRPICHLIFRQRLRRLYLPLRLQTHRKPKELLRLLLRRRRQLQRQRRQFLPHCRWIKSDNRTSFNVNAVRLVEGVVVEEEVVVVEEVEDAMAGKI